MIFDTDVLIWVLQGSEKAGKALNDAGARSVSIVSCMEMLQGARDKRDLAHIRELLAGLEVIPVSEEMSYRALVYMEEHALKTRLSPADALVAAAAAERHEVLCTANEKHFSKVEGLLLERFRP